MTLQALNSTLFVMSGEDDRWSPAVFLKGKVFSDYFFLFIFFKLIITEVGTMTVQIQSSIHPSNQSNMLILLTQICIFQIFIKSEPFHTFTHENLDAHFNSE